MTPTTKDGPEKGDPAPDFTLPAVSGPEESDVTLSDHRGRRVLLYFYPKDDTPGCTTQACDLRDRLPRFTDSDVVVLGVSPDPVESHEKFRQKFDLNFPLLADEDHEVAEAYGVWKKKKLFGNEFMGVERSTFLVGPDGRLERVWRNVDAGKHADLVSDYLEL